jgi:hypothetical protein
MGQQQLLLLILGAIIVGIAMMVGISLFAANDSQANKDGVTSKLNNIAADAAQYKLRPKTLGGGRPSYVGYVIPEKMRSDENGTYAIIGSPSDVSVTFQATSSMNASWTASCVMDSTAQSMINFSGW